MKDQNENKGQYCPNCRTWRLEPTNFCPDCGTFLGAGERGGGRKKRILSWLVLVVIGCGLGYIIHGMLAPAKRGPNPADRLEAAAPGFLGDQSEPTATAEPENIKEAPQEIEGVARGVVPSQKTLPAGSVVVKNPWGKLVSEIPAAIMGGSWVALPVKALLGGDRMTLRMANDRTYEISRGIWRDGDIVSLWQVGGGFREEGPELGPWESEEPVEWKPLASGWSRRRVDVRPGEAYGAFVKCMFSEDLSGPGLLMQKDRVVGWTFGTWLEGGYLWSGQEGRALGYQTTMENFYFVTFASGREEQFSKALSLGDWASSLDRLAALADGFHLAPRLTTENTPKELRREAVVRTMLSLAGRLLKEGEASRVADIFDERVLIEASDTELLALLVHITFRAYGPDRAVELAEGAGDDLRRKPGVDMSEVDDLHARIYASWLSKLLRDEETEYARQIYRRARDYFPEDPVIHLQGVELLLKNGEWEEAQGLLESRSYPENLTARVRLLKNRIAELKSEASKIIVRFAPGSREIPVTAFINDDISLDFLIDTGASVVTIPTSAVEDLGLKIDYRTPVRRITGIGGVKGAREVRLSAITLGEWSVYDVPALIVDIPGKPDMGLLGLSYLNHFDLEINNDEGLLLLKPK